jgi:uncharacterized protein
MGKDGGVRSGAHLAGIALAGECNLFYWREVSKEVDFILRRNGKLAAIEVKSGRRSDTLPGMAAFDRAFHPGRTLIVGTGGIPLEDFLKMTAGNLI